MIGKVLSGRYRITGELGRGGMGVVYKSVDSMLRREVAIKMLSPTLVNRDAERRIELEAQTVARLEHPAIVPIHDMGRHYEMLYLVMPLVAGETLKTLIGGDDLRLGDILEIGVQGAQALGYSHKSGVIHRDIKPGNLLLSRSGGQVRLRILDFGLARRYDQEDLTRSTRVAGTLAYLSPEVVEGGSKVGDPSSDLYALGAVLYECLAGAPPFGGSLFQTLYRIVHEAPVGLIERGVAVDLELEAIILDCLKKDPASRPASGEELARRLARYRDHLAESEWARHTSKPSTTGREKIGPRKVEPLVGREQEMQTLEERLARVLVGECGFTVVAGDAGTGKTRLAQELVEQARERRFLVLHGRFSELETTFQYQALCELIEDFYRGGESSYGDRGVPDLTDLAPDLLQLYPALAEIPELRRENLPLSGREDGRLREETWIFELLADALLRLAGGRPMVLVLEDLHAGDSGLEALQYLVRRLSLSQTFFLGTFRPGEIDRAHPLTRVLASFENDPRFSRLELGPLDAHGTRELAEGLIGGPALDADIIEELWEATEGNPLFCRELIGALLESQALHRDDLGLWTLEQRRTLSETLPATLRQAEERRIEHLDERERRLLAAAAVLGRTFDVSDLVAITSRGDSSHGDREAEAEEILDGLIDRGLLREARSTRGRELIFTSGILHELLASELSRRKRRRLHTRAARHLERRWAGRLERVLPQLVEHCRAADLEEETVRYGLDLARRSLELASPEDAARGARVALEFAEDLEDGDGQRFAAQATELLARASTSLGENDKALRFAEEATRRFEELGHKAGQARTALLAADIAWTGRQIEEVRRWVSRGLEAARGGVAPEALDRLSSLGITLANLHGERSEALYLEEVRAQELSAPADEEATRPGGHFVVSLPFRPQSIDPSRVLTMEEWEIAGNIFETLLATDEHGLLVPRLCETWRGSADHRVFSLLLRPNLRLSNGQALNGEMIKAALERAARWHFGEPPPAFSAVSGIEAFLAGESQELEGLELSEKLGDRQQLVFRLRQPLPIFPALLTDLRTAVARAEDDGRLLGTGPFQLESIAEDRRSWKLVPNAHWRGRKPSIESLEWRVLSDPWALGSALRTGEIDLAGDMVAEDLDDLVRLPEMRRGLVEAIRRNIYFAIFNCRRVPPAVRRVMCSAVRVSDLVWASIGRRAVPASGLVPPGLLGHDASHERTLLSPRRAEELLDAAGIERPIRLEAAIHPLFFERYAPLLSALFDAWARLGIEVVPENKDLTTFVAALSSDSESDLMIGRWGAAYQDPDNFTHNLLNSRTGLLRHFFSSPEADLLLERARLETRASSRQVLYRRLEAKIEEVGAILPLFHEVDYRLLAPRWSGLHLSSRAPYVDYTRLALRAEEPTEAEAGHGEIRVAQTSMLETLDPAAGNYLDHHELALNIFEPLSRVDEHARLEPWLAESIEPQLGGRAFRIRLRQEVRFHDGRHLGSRDVRYSFERVLRDKEELRHLLLPIRGAAAFVSGNHQHLAGCIMHSATELTLELQRAMPSFPQLLTHPCLSIVPEGCDPESHDPSVLVGTGPFRITAWKPGQEVELERHHLYWRSTYPRVDRLFFYRSAGADHRVREFESGRLSILSDIRPKDVERLRRSTEKYRFYEAPGLITFFLVLNRHRGPLADVALRSELIRRFDFAPTVRALGRLASPAESVVPPGLINYERGELHFDINEFEGALDGLHLTLARHPIFNDRYRELGDELISRLERTGIDIEERPCPELKDMARYGEEGSVDLILTRWAALFADVDGFAAGLFSRHGGFLAGLLAGEDLEQLIDQARQEGDPALRRHLYHRFEDTLAREHLVLPLFHEQVYRFTQPEIRGLRLFVTAPQVRYGELAIASPDRLDSEI